MFRPCFFSRRNAKICVYADFSLTAKPQLRLGGLGRQTSNRAPGDEDVFYLFLQKQIHRVGADEAVCAQYAGGPGCCSLRVFLYNGTY
jgi:hypothetical protein